jgi:hypothetical protein
MPQGAFQNDLLHILPCLPLVVVLMQAVYLAAVFPRDSHDHVLMF